jgi:hypothetical protein
MDIITLSALCATVWLVAFIGFGLVVYARSCAAKVFGFVMFFAAIAVCVAYQAGVR